MNISTHSASQADMDQRCKDIAELRSVSMMDAEAVWKWEMTPRNYIFAFATEMDCEAIGDAVGDWYDARGESPTPFQPFLPRLIAAPDTVAIQN